MYGYGTGTSLARLSLPVLALGRTPAGTGFLVGRRQGAMGDGVLCPTGEQAQRQAHTRRLRVLGCMTHFPPFSQKKNSGRVERGGGAFDILHR